MALKTDELTSIERVVLAMQHKEADRVPVAPLASGAARRVLGVTYAEYAQDAELAAQSQIQWMQLTGGDAVCTFLDLSVEAHDFGQEVKYPIEDTPHPVFRNPLIKSTDDYARVHRDRSAQGQAHEHHPPLPGAMMQALGRENVIMGFIYGPLGTLSKMRSAEKLFLDCMKEPGEGARGLEIVTQVLLDYVDAQVDRRAPSAS